MAFQAIFRIKRLKNKLPQALSRPELRSPIFFDSPLTGLQFCPGQIHCFLGFVHIQKICLTDAIYFVQQIHILIPFFHFPVIGCLCFHNSKGVRGAFFNCFGN